MHFLEYYDSEWLNQDTYFKEHRERFLQSFKMVMEYAQPGLKVLEVGGCGPLGKYLKIFHNATLFETKSDLRYSLNIQDNFFDLILCTEVIEHIKDQESDKITHLERFNYSGIINMLNELKDSLCTTGHLFITTPNACSIHTLNNWVESKPLLFCYEHVREFSIDDLVKTAKLADLKLKHYCSVASWNHPHANEKTNLLMQYAEKIGVDMKQRGDNVMAIFTK